MKRPIQAVCARRGAASLLVVMAMFFAISMVAAYTGRNLIYEQRTSANQLRAVAAQEASEAAVEWALARLNEGRMADNCEPLASASMVNSSSPQPSFRQRYLSVNHHTGVLSPQPNRVAGCAFDGTRWVCDCPESGNPNPSVTPTGTGPFPAFWVRFVQPNPSAPPAGMIYVQTSTCTRNDSSCLQFESAAQFGDAVASNWVLLALKTALLTPPAATLTSRGNIAATDRTFTQLVLVNTDRNAGGLNIQGGCSTFTGSALSGVTIPGTPTESSFLTDDTSISKDLVAPRCPINDSLAVSNEHARQSMFVGMFGATPDSLRQQPGVTFLDCSTTCTASVVNQALLLNPDSPVLLGGAGGLYIDQAMGMTSAHPNPVLLVVDGNVTASSAGSVVNGLVFSRANRWDYSGTATINGAIVAEKEFNISGGSTTVHYDSSVLTRLRRNTGTFVKVPGGWRDFPASP